MKKTQTFINENIPSFLHHKRKGESLPFLSSSSNIPKISKETLDQIEYLINKKITPPSLSLDNSKLRSYLSSLSIREKYEDLLTRKSLLLPPKYKLLLKKQTFLDFILSNDNSLKSKFTYIKEQFTKECSIPFTIDDFEKILFIAPFYYIYQAKKKIDDTTELVCIDLPKDYAERTPVRIFLIFIGEV